MPSTDCSSSTNRIGADSLGKNSTCFISLIGLLRSQFLGRDRIFHARR
ncbi:hypothetical protein [Nostoc commune]|nr:hypothetical protein [Nostoc commune]